MSFPCQLCLLTPLDLDIGFFLASLSQDIVPFFKSLSHNIAFFRNLFLLTFPHRPLFLVTPFFLTSVSFTSFPEISCPWHPLTWQSHYIVIFSSLPPCLSWHFFLLWLLVLWSGVSCFSLSACGDIWFPYGSISFLISFSRHRLLPSLDIAPRPGSRHPPAPAMQPSPQKNHWVAKRCKTNTFQTSPGRRPGRSR